MSGSLQRLRVHTASIDAATVGTLLDSLPDNPLTFLRGGEGLVGSGEVVTLKASGAKRILELSDAWRQLTANADVTDPLGWPGTGLIAFGSIGFADSSALDSVMVVPSRVIGVRDGRAWVTDICWADEATGDGSGQGSAAPFESSPYRENTAVVWAQGQQTGEGFKASVSSAVDAIRAGRLQKVVLARDISAVKPEEFDIRPTLKKLALRYPSCWVYSVDGTFGASPELLVRVAHGQVSARVLAGTAGRGTDPGVDRAIADALSTSPKNLAEHAFAVDSLVKELHAFCDRVDADETPFSLALPNLWHLASDVHGVLRQDASVLDLANALHPTAAVAGTPRQDALALIEELEPFDRGRYAGPVGWIGADGDGEWAIALRGGQMGAAKITAFAGCGIVAESEPEAELAETELKFQPVRDAL